MCLYARCRWATSGFQGCAAERGSRWFCEGGTCPPGSAAYGHYVQRRPPVSPGHSCTHSRPQTDCAFCGSQLQQPLQCGKLGRCGTSSTLLFSFLLMLSFTLSFSPSLFFALPLSCILAANPAHYSPAWLAYFPHFSWITQIAQIPMKPGSTSLWLCFSTFKE